MPDKSFEHVIQFIQVAGRPTWFPIVTITLVQSTGARLSLPLLFDTGASITTLRADLYPLLEVTSWDAGTPLQLATAGGINLVTTYVHTATFEVFGKAISAPVSLAQLPPNPLFVGLLGRDTIFEQFGFGFWEGSRELFVTGSP